MTRHAERSRQKGKGHKRPKAWHRGAGEARLWRSADLPDVATGADPTAGAPTPLTNRRSPAARRHHP
jgi:hypothetical protein